MFRMCRLDELVTVSDSPAGKASEPSIEVAGTIHGLINTPPLTDNHYHHLLEWIWTICCQKAYIGIHSLTLQIFFAKR